MGLFHPDVENPQGSRLVSRPLGPDPEPADGRALVIEDTEEELAVCWYSPQETVLSIARWHCVEQYLAVLLL